MSFEPPGPAERHKRVLVAGGGPAGLEAARTAALRGHEVHLYEATRRLGGQVSIASSAPHRADIGAITSWLAGEVERLGVTIRLNTMVDPDVVAELAPDEVIVATGGSPRRDGFQLSTPVTPVAGHDLPHVFSSWDVFGFGGRAHVVGLLDARRSLQTASLAIAEARIEREIAIAELERATGGPLAGGAR